MRFLVHYPDDQMMKVGPMVRIWTIRYEANLNFFKQASHIGTRTLVIVWQVATKDGYVMSWPVVNSFSDHSNMGELYVTLQ